MTEHELTLHKAVAQGNLEHVREIAEQGVSLNSIDDGGMTPLQTAALKGHLKIAEYLISKGAKVNAEARSFCPLVQAIIANNAEMVKLLINHGADINKPERTFGTPLHVAVTLWNDRTTMENKIEMVNLLLSHGASVTAKNDMGNNALEEALIGRLEPLAEVLELYGAVASPAGLAAVEVLIRPPVHYDKSRLFRLAIRCGHLERVKEVLTDHPSWLNTKNPFGYFPLHEAVLAKQLPIVEFLVEEGAQINEKTENGSTPHSLAIKIRAPEIAAFLRSKGATDEPGLAGAIHEAAATGNIETLKNLLDRNPAFLNARDEFLSTPLHYAALYEQPETLNLLLSKKAQVDAKDETGKTPLHHAAGRKTEILDLLIAAGAAIDSPDKSGWTPLLTAAAADSLEAVKYFIQKGANPYVQELQMEDTILHIAVKFNHGDVVKYLLKDKVINVDARNKKGWTPLFTAAMTSRAGMAKLLLLNGAEVDGRDIDLDCTPLHAAVNQGSLEVARILVEHKADINAKNRNGNTPLSYAELKEFDTIIDFLLRHGARQLNQSEAEEAEKKTSQYISSVTAQAYGDDDEPEDEDARPWWKKMLGIDNDNK